MSRSQNMGDLTHQLLFCPVLAEARVRAVGCWSSHMEDRPHLLPLVVAHTTQGTVEDHMAILMDPTSCPLIISAAQEMGETVYSDCLYMSRVWCHSIHHLRMKLFKQHSILK